eukprot:scaffold129933_cov48-Phaeocystis_antarctica.AAC.1
MHTPPCLPPCLPPPLRGSQRPHCGGAEGRRAAAAAGRSLSRRLLVVRCPLGRGRGKHVARPLLEPLGRE